MWVLSALRTAEIMTAHLRTALKTADSPKKRVSSSDAIVVYRRLLYVTVRLYKSYSSIACGASYDSRRINYIYIRYGSVFIFP